MSRRLRQTKQVFASRIHNLAAGSSVAFALAESNLAMPGMETNMSALLKLNLAVQSRVELIDYVCERVASFLHKLNFGEDDIYAIDLSLREAAVNAMKHGNGFDPALQVSVSIEVSDADCTIRIADSGKNKKAVLKSQAGLLAPNGRGLLMMRTLMNSVEFVRSGDGLEVVLHRRVQKSPENVAARMPAGVHRSHFTY
jgi:serine/threonine-protein kinase RsbW